MKKRLYVLVLVWASGLIQTPAFSQSEAATADDVVAASLEQVIEVNPQEKGRWFAAQVRDSARNNPSYAVQIADQALSHFKNFPDHFSHSIVLNESSYAYYFLDQLPQSIARAKTAEIFSRSHDLKKSIARAQQLQANVLQSIGEYHSALNLYREAMAIYREKNNQKDYGGVLNNIANTYFLAGQYDLAMEFYSLAGEAAETLRDEASMYLGYGHVLGEQNKIEASIDAYKKALELSEVAQDHVVIEAAQSGMAYQLLAQNKPGQALKLIESTLKSSLEANRRFREVSNLLSKAKAHMQLEQTDKALTTIDSAILHASTSEDKNSLVASYKIKSKILERIGQHAEALDMLKIALDVEKTYVDSQSKISLAVMRAVFEVEQKNHQIDLLSSQNRVQQLEIEQQQVLLLASVGAFIFALAITFFVFHYRTQARLLADEKLVSVRLKELDGVKDQVLVNTSHELRTPLNGIIGLTQVVLEDDENQLPSTTRAHIELVAQCGHRLLNLVDDIIDMTQLRTGRLQLNTGKINVSSVVQYVCAFVKPLADKKELKIEAIVEDGSLEVTVDVKRLHQVLLNLVGNAIKFSLQGVIQVKASRAPNGVKFSVIDQGIGIEEHDLQKIFMPFTQVDSSLSRDNEGTGLGLPITQELLLLHNSRLDVKSTPGEGSEFYFVLPAEN